MTQQEITNILESQNIANLSKFVIRNKDKLNYNHIKCFNNFFNNFYKSLEKINYHIENDEKIIITMLSFIKKIEVLMNYNITLNTQTVLLYLELLNFVDYNKKEKKKVQLTYLHYPRFLINNRYLEESLFDSRRLKIYFGHNIIQFAVSLKSLKLVDYILSNNYFPHIAYIRVSKKTILYYIKGQKMLDLFLSKGKTYLNGSNWSNQDCPNARRSWFNQLYLDFIEIFNYSLKTNNYNLLVSLKNIKCYSMIRYDENLFFDMSYWMKVRHSGPEMLNLLDLNCWYVVNDDPNLLNKCTDEIKLFIRNRGNKFITNPEITYIYLKKLNKFNKYILYQIISFLPNIKDIKDEINYEKKIRKDIQIEISDWFSNYKVFEPDDEDYYHEDYNEDYYHEDY